MLLSSRSNWHCLVWDVTCPDMFAPSYAALTGETVGTVADRAEDLKKLKYQDIKLSPFCTYCNLRCFGGPSSFIYVRTGEHTKEETGESNAYFYLVQRLSVALQRWNERCQWWDCAMWLTVV